MLALVLSTRIALIVFSLLNSCKTSTTCSAWTAPVAPILGRTLCVRYLLSCVFVLVCVCLSVLNFHVCPTILICQSIPISLSLSLSLYIYIYIYIYICIYVINLHVRISDTASINLWFGVSDYACVLVYTIINVFVRTSMFDYVCVCVYVLQSVYLYMCVFSCIIVRICTWVILRVKMCVYMRMCVREWVIVSKNVCVCVHLRE